MIQLSNITIAFSGRAILDGVNWHIDGKDRIGLVGNNGSGKSTLMKLIAGINTADEGDVVSAKTVTMGYLPQDGIVHEGLSLYDETVNVFGDIKGMQKESGELMEQMQFHEEDSPDYRRMAERYAEIEEHIQLNDGYQLEKKIEKVLIGLGFKHEDLKRDCGEFSGGWQMRIALAKVLLAKPNILLLDEPTNYLDIEARVFLQNWLVNYEHAILLVSHDRHFLDNVVNRITEIHDGVLTDYFCNYTRYTIEREERIERLKAQAEKVEAERERLQTFIDRFRYKADKASLVQSRVKQLEKLEKIEIPTVRKKIRFNFPQPERSGKIAIEAENLVAGYGDGPDVFRNFAFRLERGEKVALVGVNGAGKSTLMKVLSGNLNQRDGEFRLGHNVDMDYFAQEAHKTLDPTATVYQTLERCAPFEMVPKLRNMLGAFLFSGDDIDKKVSILSGGERNRLALARMLLVPSNLLLMDEPTNHLDIDAKEVLLDALKKFEGTVLFVSHDRYFLDNLATKIFAIMDGELYIYPGNYPDFLVHIERRGTSTEITKEEQEVDEKKADDKAQRVLKYKEEKKKQREKERLTKLVAKLEEQIANEEEKINQIHDEMVKPEMSTNFSKLEELTDEKEKHEKTLDKFTEEWEEALIQLEELESED